ncbi:MAG: hypothetical protein V1784_04075, partial [bacterium]
EVETGDTINLADKPTDQVVEPPNGFCLYPSSAKISVGKRYAFELRVSTKTMPHASTVAVICTNPKIHVLTPEISLSAERDLGIVRKYITIEGSEPDIEGVLRATTDNRQSEAKVYVIPEKELLLTEGMVFQPETLTVRPNKPRKVYLFVYIKVIEGGSTIKISSDNESVYVSQDALVVNEADATRHVVKYELEVWGEGVGQHAVVTAEYETFMALLEVHVKSEEDEEPRGKGMFSEPDFSQDPQPLQRTSYSPGTGRVTIYVNFPSVKHYLGANCEYRKTLPAQVLIADLLAERCFHEIARKKVEESGSVLSPLAVPDRIQRDTYELSKKYGKRVHEAFVDKKQLAAVKLETRSQN